MMRIVLAATNSAKSRMITSAIRAAMGGPPRSRESCSYVDERRRAADRHDLHLGAGLDDAVLVVGARGPFGAVDAHAPEGMVVVDGLKDHRRAADQGRRAGADLRRLVEVALGDRPDEPEAGERQHGEDDALQRAAAAGQGDEHPPEGADGERREEEPRGEELAPRRRARGGRGGGKTPGGGFPPPAAMMPASSHTSHASMVRRL